MKKAFTLSEVLITLGVIGVVAAMTMPVLISNYQKKVYVNQLKKTISTLQQGFQRMMADDGVDNLEYTSVFSASRNGNGEECMMSGDMETNACKVFIEGIKKYFNIIECKIPQNYLVKAGPESDIIVNVTSFGDYYCFFPDGSMVRFDTTYFNQTTTSASGERYSYVHSLGISLDINGIRKPNIRGYDEFYLNVADNGKLVEYDKYLDRIMKNGWKIDY